MLGCWRIYLPAGAALLLGLLLCTVSIPATAQVDSEALAGRIAKSINKIRDPRYRTAAFSRVRNAGTRINVNQLIDYANVKIVRGRRLRMIDRSKLNLILKEQKVQLSEFVSVKKYQELGRLMGVDLFIYGTIYSDALVLKAIDVQKSSIAWADVFALRQSAGEAGLLLALGGGVVNSLRKDLARLKKANLRRVSFWDFKPTQVFNTTSLADYLSVAITRDGNFEVVDRENLQLITKEQKLNQAVFIDQNNAKRLGELYGVDAFIYGGITRRSDGIIVASLKMLNIYNGVIEWADLIKLDGNAAMIKPGPSGGRSAQRKRGKGALAGMVFISPGEFVMGTNGDPKQSNPRRRVKLPGYYIEINEVTNRDYAVFVKKRRYRKPHYWGGKSYPQGEGGRPVVGVSWEDARLYCRFMRKRLPTEAEWEKAARGNQGVVFAWGGKTFVMGYTVSRESRHRAPVPVSQKTRDISPYGVRFMAGNVREWVAGAYRPYPGGSFSAPKGQRVIRGGSWAKDRRSARTFHREGSTPNNAWPDVGFRCAK